MLSTTDPYERFSTLVPDGYQLDVINRLAELVTFLGNDNQLNIFHRFYNENNDKYEVVFGYGDDAEYCTPPMVGFKDTRVHPDSGDWLKPNHSVALAFFEDIFQVDVRVQGHMTFLSRPEVQHVIERMNALTEKFRKMKTN